MTGQSRVISNRLRQLHQETCGVVAQFTAVSFRHVLRGHNCLADALATEALNGRVVQMRARKSGRGGKKSAFKHPLSRFL
ncbi:MAG: reverse transcriptase-like protein [Ketobacter sp.]|nr:reverse transcriptase-like protein [Ketobacter sp.]